MSVRAEDMDNFFAMLVGRPDSDSFYGMEYLGFGLYPIMFEGGRFNFHVIGLLLDGMAFVGRADWGSVTADHNAVG